MSCCWKSGSSVLRAAVVLALATIVWVPMGSWPALPTPWGLWSASLPTLPVVRTRYTLTQGAGRALGPTLSGCRPFARITSTSRLPFLSQKLIWMSPRLGLDRVWRPTIWPGPKPSTILPETMGPATDVTEGAPRTEDAPQVVAESPDSEPSPSEDTLLACLTRWRTSSGATCGSWGI